LLHHQRRRRGLVRSAGSMICRLAAVRSGCRDHVATPIYSSEHRGWPPPTCTCRYFLVYKKKRAAPSEAGLASARPQAGTPAFSPPEPRKSVTELRGSTLALPNPTVRPGSTPSLAQTKASAAIAGTGPHPRRDWPTSAPGLAHVCGGTLCRWVSARRS
jgi:hypothetical protein